MVFAGISKEGIVLPLEKSGYPLYAMRIKSSVGAPTDTETTLVPFIIPWKAASIKRRKEVVKKFTYRRN